MYFYKRISFRYHFNGLRRKVYNFFAQQKCYSSYKPLCRIVSKVYAMHNGLCRIEQKASCIMVYASLFLNPFTIIESQPKCSVFEPNFLGNRVPSVANLIHFPRQLLSEILPSFSDRHIPNRECQGTRFLSAYLRDSSAESRGSILGTFLPWSKTEAGYL